MIKTLLPIILILLASCSQKTIDSIAKSDSQKKLKRIINDRLVRTNSTLLSQADTNKLKELILNQCAKPSEIRYLGTYKGFDDSKNRMISIEFMSCNDTWTMWNYKIIGNHPQLLGVWIDKFENREKNIGKYIGVETWE
jgi:hypothetical protein